MKSRVQPRRRGSVLALTAFMLVPLLAFLALAVDLGYLAVARTELQRTADASAIAAAWELIDKNAGAGVPNLTEEIASCRTKAAQSAAWNPVCNGAPILDANYANLPSGDIVVGTLENPSDRNCQMTYLTPNAYNAVQVTVRRNSLRNGNVPFFFAPVLGHTGMAAEAQATAAVMTNFGGFRAPSGGGNLDLLPYALDEETWDNLIKHNIGTDDWCYNQTTRTISPGSDGVREVNLFPQGTGSPGNRGTVDIGGSDNSTADIARQIVDGVSPADLAHHGGCLEFDSHGELILNGDTGISAGVQDELASIRGRPRIIPIFRSVTDPGNNAQYTIVKFVGVRILEVELNGIMNSKRVMIQPAAVITRGGKPGTATQTSWFIYSPAWLVR